MEDPIRRQEARDRREATRAPVRTEPPDERPEERTPSMEAVLHRAEALAAVSPPVDAPATPINDTGKVESMARMGGDINVMGGLADPLRSAGATTAGEDIGLKLKRFLDEESLQVIGDDPLRRDR